MKIGVYYVEQGMVQQESKPSLFGMIWSPGEQFDRIRNNPKILLALLVVTALFLIGILVTALSLSIDDVIGMGIPEEEAEFVLGFTKVITIVTGLITPLIGALIYTVVHLVIVVVAKTGTTFKQLFSMNTYILLIGAIGFLFNTFVQQLIGGPLDMYITSLAGLLNSESAVLGTIELFAIWQLFLTAIGLNKVGQLSKGVSWTIAIIFFLISLGMTAGSAFLAGVAGV